MHTDPRVTADVIHQMSWGTYLGMIDAIQEVEEEGRAKPLSVKAREILRDAWCWLRGSI